MAVYVDSSIWPFGRMMMCHMIADTRRELDEMADKIGVARKWIQYPNNPHRIHYDICKSMRAKAVVLGAIEKECTEMPWHSNEWMTK